MKIYRIAIISMLAIIIVVLVGIFINTMPTECVVCGGITHDRYRVSSMDMTELVDVCRQCYIVSEY